MEFKFKNYNIVNVLQFIISLLTLILGYYALKEWKNEKKFEIKLEQIENVPMLFNIFENLFSSKNDTATKEIIDYSDKLIYSEFKNKIDSVILKKFILDKYRFETNYFNYREEISNSNNILYKLIYSTDEDNLKREDIIHHSLILREIYLFNKYSESFKLLKENYINSKKKDLRTLDDLKLIINNWYNKNNKFRISEMIEGYNKEFMVTQGLILNKPILKLLGPPFGDPTKPGIDYHKEKINIQ